MTEYADGCDGWSAQGGVHFPDEDLGRFCRGDLLSAGGGEAYRVAGRERPGSFQGDAAGGRTEMVRQAFLIAETSNSRVTLSLTRTPPVSSAAFQVMP